MYFFFVAFVPFSLSIPIIFNRRIQIRGHRIRHFFPSSTHIELIHRIHIICNCRLLIPGSKLLIVFIELTSFQSRNAFSLISNCRLRKMPPSGWWSTGTLRSRWWASSLGRLPLLEGAWATPGPSSLGARVPLPVSIGPRGNTIDFFRRDHFFPQGVGSRGKQSKSNNHVPGTSFFFSFWQKSSPPPLIHFWFWPFSKGCVFLSQYRLLSIKLFLSCLRVQYCTRFLIRKLRVKFSRWHYNFTKHESKKSCCTKLKTVWDPRCPA